MSSTIDYQTISVPCPKCKKETGIDITIIQDNTSCEVDSSWPSKTECEECGKSFRVTKKMIQDAFFP